MRLEERKLISNEEAPLRHIGHGFLEVSLILSNLERKLCGKVM